MGHVFAGRYKSLLVGGEGGYLRTVCDYVHLNPIRAKLLPPEAALRAYRWSSFPLFIARPSQRPDWLRVDRLFGECGIPQDSAAGWGEFEQRLEALRDHKSDEGFQSMRGEWCFGNEQFRQELLAQVERGAGQYHYGPEIQEAAEAKANRLIDEELRRAVWTEAELAFRKKGDPGKIQIACRLRAETTVTLQWIAARLHMGTKTHLSHLLYWTQRAERKGGFAASVPVRKGLEVDTSDSQPNYHQEKRRGKAVPGRDKPPVPTHLIENPTLVGTIPLTDPLGVGGFDTSFD